MSNFKSNIPRIIAVAVLSLIAAACSTSASRRSVGTTADDTVVLGRVKAALIENDTTKAREINVDVYRGVVQLNGFVDSAAEKSTATKVAKNVNGVKEVRNNLEVKASRERTAGNVVDDSVLTARVKSALVADSRTKIREINVTTNDGIVQLGGFVDSSDAKAAAAEVARAVQGVKSVRNELDVKPQQ